jgi:hypothetical protein
MKILKLFAILFLFNALKTFSQTSEEELYAKIDLLIEQGNFKIAKKLIDSILYFNNPSPDLAYNLNWKKDLMFRIQYDFSKTKEQILPYIKKYIPEVNDQIIYEWEKDGSLEYKIIDNEKFYFKNADRNLFRVNQKAKERKILIDGNKQDELDLFLKNHLPKVVNEALRHQKRLIKPIEITLKYKVVIKPNAVPEGEIIRGWLPFPRISKPRQINPKLLSANSKYYIISDNDNYLQRTIYMEQIAKKDKPVIFEVSYSFISYNYFANIDPNQIKPYTSKKDVDFLKQYTSERPPHIIFSEPVREISKVIIGNETNPYLIAKKTFEWIRENIPWASALEYSTIPSLTNYCLQKMYGDCGIVTMLFMSILRYNGIPCKWQSGFMLQPGSENLHDWCEVYFEGYGWVPVDVSFGPQTSPDPNVKYFFINGVDAFRMVICDDYGQNLFPAKVYPRSEPLDFQRGEFEWKGGNLYFDKWTYSFEINYKELE